MTTDLSNTYGEMERLYNDSRVVKRAHFSAAQGKQRARTIIGLAIIALNVLISSSLIDVLVADKAAVLIRILAVFAAAFAAIQTFFNFQKDVEAHHSAGDAYGSINRRVRLLVAEFKDGSRKPDDIIADFKALTEEYLKANTRSKGCIPTDRDYYKARAAIERSDDREGRVGSI